MEKQLNQKYQVYVGTYASESQPGIYHYEVEAAGSEPTWNLRGSTSGIANPSFLAIDDAQHVLYAVSETGDGTVVSYNVHGDGTLGRWSAASTHGGSPCHVILNSETGYLVCANYSGGSIALFPVSADGQVSAACDVIRHTGHGVNTDRQEGPHPHSAMLDPTKRFVLVPDLGIDKIMIYEVQKNPLRLILHAEAPLKPGAGPRHFAFHPSNGCGYVINELDSTITAFAYDGEQGLLTERQTVSALPEDFTGESTSADIHISPDGRFLYGSNRGHDSIVVFAIHPDTGRLSYVQHESTRGRVPRNFALTPDGRYALVANQESDSITTYTVDAQSGRLTFTGIVTEVPKPTCVIVRQA